jgi:hypothetical protein
MPTTNSASGSSGTAHTVTSGRGPSRVRSPQRSAQSSSVRVRAWRDACLAHPAAQQITREESLKVHYDDAKVAGNGAPLPGRSRSSFVFEPHWRTRPWPRATSTQPAPTTPSSGSDLPRPLLALVCEGIPLRVIFAPCHRVSLHSRSSA